jgi:hypothetical protein
MDIAHCERVSACCQRQIDSAQSLIREVKKLQYYEIVRQLGVDMQRFFSDWDGYTRHVDMPEWSTSSQMARDILTKHSNCEVSDELLVCLYTYHYKVKTYRFKSMNKTCERMHHYVICNVDAYDFDTESECIYVPSYAGWDRVFNGCFHLPECMELDVIQRTYQGNGWDDKIISILKDWWVAG